MTERERTEVKRALAAVLCVSNMGFSLYVTEGGIEVIGVSRPFRIKPGLADNLKVWLEEMLADGSLDGAECSAEDAVEEEYASWLRYLEQDDKLDTADLTWPDLKPLVDALKKELTHVS
jgi:hypothetical protein